MRRLHGAVPERNRPLLLDYLPPTPDLPLSWAQHCWPTASNGSKQRPKTIHAEVPVPRGLQCGSAAAGRPGPTSGPIRQFLISPNCKERRRHNLQPWL